MVGKRPTRWTDRDSLPYCNAVLKECMRYKPIFQWMFHVAQDDVTVNYKGNEYTIPKGALIWSARSCFDFSLWLRSLALCA